MGQGGKERKKAEKAAAQTPKVKLSHRDKLVQDVGNVSKRLTRLTKKLDKLPPELDVSIAHSDTQSFGFKVVEGVEAMVEAFDGLAADIAALPADWKPGRAKRGSSLVVNIGDIVQIREKSAPKYADMVPPNTDLLVTKVGAALIEVQHALDGVVTKVYVPRGHLTQKEVQA